MFRDLIETFVARSHCPQTLPLLEQKPLKKWIRSGHAQFAPLELSGNLASFLQTLPWRGNGLDASRIVCQKTYLDPDWVDTEAREWFLRTPLGRASLVLIYFAHDLPCLVCTPKFAITHIGDFGHQGSYRRQLFGAQQVDGHITLLTQYFGEFDGERTLWTTV